MDVMTKGGGRDGDVVIAKDGGCDVEFLRHRN